MDNGPTKLMDTSDDAGTSEALGNRSGGSSSVERAKDLTEETLPDVPPSRPRNGCPFPALQVAPADHIEVVVGDLEDSQECEVDDALAYFHRINLKYTNGVVFRFVCKTCKIEIGSVSMEEPFTFCPYCKAAFKRIPDRTCSGTLLPTRD